MKKTMFILTVLLMAGISILATSPRDLKFDPLQFKPPEPERFVTDNGIVVYFLEDHQLPVVTASAYFKGGEAYDSPGKAGLADLTANLLRSGGAGERTPVQVDEDLDFVDAGVTTSASNETILVNMNTLKKDVDMVFEIMSDIIIRPRFDSAKMELEISNLKNGIIRQNDDPGTVTRRIYYETVYKAHPYGQNPTLSTVGTISRNDIMAQHDEYYTPDNCYMAIAGDMTIDEVKELIEKYFSDWKKGNDDIVSPSMAVMNYTPGVYYAKRDMNQAHIRFGQMGLDSKNPDRYAMDVMNFALGGGGFSSRMTNMVRTTSGLAYSVGTYAYNRPFGGTFFAYCQTRAEAAGKALRMMLDIIKDVKENGITEDELKLAKESIINGYVFGYDTPSKIVNDRAYKDLLGFPPDQLERDLKAYQAVTLADCNRVAQKYLEPDKMVIIITGNRELFDEPLEDFGPVTRVSLEIN